MLQPAPRCRNAHTDFEVLRAQTVSVSGTNCECFRLKLCQEALDFLFIKSERAATELMEPGCQHEAEEGGPADR